MMMMTIYDDDTTNLSSQDPCLSMFRFHVGWAVNLSQPAWTRRSWSAWTSSGGACPWLQRRILFLTGGEGNDHSEKETLLKKEVSENKRQKVRFRRWNSTTNRRRHFWDVFLCKVVWFVWCRSSSIIGQHPHVGQFSFRYFCEKYIHVHISIYIYNNQICLYVEEHICLYSG